MSEHLFSVVTTNDKREVVERYLYDHTTIVDEKVIEGDAHTVRVMILMTKSNVGNATFLRRYQLDRLASGLMFGVPADAFDDAMRKLDEAASKSYF